MEARDVENTVAKIHAGGEYSCSTCHYRIGMREIWQAWLLRGRTGGGRQAERK